MQCNRNPLSSLKYVCIYYIFVILAHCMHCLNECEKNVFNTVSTLNNISKNHRFINVTK